MKEELKQFALLFEKDLLNELSKLSKPVNVAAGDVVLDIGQKINFIPLVLRGTIKISRTDDQGRELLLYYVNPNESCALTFTCCMQQTSSEIRAVAEEDATMLLLPISVMDEWIARYPTWKAFVMNTIRERFMEMIRTIDQIAFQKLDERLAKYLNQKRKVTGSSVINLSHQQIADELATSRVVISRLLKKLENDKKILLYRNQLKILHDL